MLLGGSHPYSSEESCNVVSYKPDCVSIPAVGAQSVPLLDILSRRAAEQLINFESELLLDDSDIANVLDSDGAA